MNKNMELFWWNISSTERRKFKITKYDWFIYATLITSVTFINLILCFVLSCSGMSNFCNPLNSIPPGSSVYRIPQARILEKVTISFSRGSSQLRDQTHITWSPALEGEFFTTEPPGMPMISCLIHFQNVRSFATW